MNGISPRHRNGGDRMSWEGGKREKSTERRRVDVDDDIDSAAGVSASASGGLNPTTEEIVSAQMEMIGRLTEEAEELRKERDESDSLLQKVAEKAEELHLSNVALQEENDRLKDENNDLQDKVNSLELQTQDLEEIHNKLCQDFSELQSVMQVMSQTESEITKNLQDCETLIAHPDAMEMQQQGIPPSSTLEDISLSQKMAARVRELQEELKQKDEEIYQLQSNPKYNGHSRYSAAGLDDEDDDKGGDPPEELEVLDYDGDRDGSALQKRRRNDTIQKLEMELARLQSENDRLERLRKASNKNSHRLAQEKMALQAALEASKMEGDKESMRAGATDTGINQPTMVRSAHEDVDRRRRTSHSPSRGNRSMPYRGSHNRGVLDVSLSSIDSQSTEHNDMSLDMSAIHPVSKTQSRRSLTKRRGRVQSMKRSGTGTASTSTSNGYVVRTDHSSKPNKGGHATTSDANKRVNFMRMRSAAPSKDDREPWWVLSKK